jgi:hypothetical protein
METIGPLKRFPVDDGIRQLFSNAAQPCDARAWAL